MHLHVYVQSISGMRTTAKWLPLEPESGIGGRGSKFLHMPCDCM